MPMVSNHGLNPEQLLMALWNDADKSTHGPREFKKQFPYVPNRFTLAQLSSNSFGDFDGKFYDSLVKALSLRPEDFKRDAFGDFVAKKFNSGSYDRLHGKRDHGRRVTAAEIALNLSRMNKV